MRNLFGFSCIATPLLEEIAYRGLGHLFVQYTWNLGLLLVARLRQWELAGIYCIAHVFVGLLCVVDGVFKSQCFQSWFILPIEMIQSALWVRAVVHGVLHLVIFKKGPTKSMADTTNTSNHRSNPGGVDDSTLRQSMLLAARLEGAKQFGLAHCAVPGPVPLGFGLRMVQKCIGTFLSSLLVESRLATQRRNLWAPIGAHVAFNTVVGNILVLMQAFFIGLNNY